jgi:hypothetical protein
VRTVMDIAKSIFSCFENLFIVIFPINVNSITRYIV